MSDIDLNEVLSPKDADAIDKLIRETNADAELIGELYRVEKTALERVATVKTYITLLTIRQVKQRLPEEQLKRKIYDRVPKLD